MPQISFAIYPPKMQEFIAHWTQVNAVLGAAPLLLRGGYPFVTFTSDRAVLVAAIGAVIPAINTLQSNIVTRNTLKTTLKSKIAQFRAACLPVGSPLLNNIPQYTTPPDLPHSPSTPRLHRTM